MADQSVSDVVVTDANIIINFVYIGRLDLLDYLPGLRFVVPEQVIAEITEPNQQAALGAALNSSRLTQATITDFDEMQRYSDLNRTLGKGESACLAIAEHRGGLLASDEKRAFRRTALESIGDGRLLTTPNLIVRAIHSGLTTVTEADEWKETLEQNRFSMKFRSFSELVTEE